MSEIAAKVPEPKREVVALLCVPDSANEGPIAFAPLYGQPLLHHFVKALEGVGITRFFIGVEAVPGALLSYQDNAKRSGLDIVFVRNPGDLATQIDDNALVLVQSTDTALESSLMRELLDLDKPLIATVDEQTENQSFERIDLNSRWTGLAVLKAGTLAPLTSLPDGWDMGSALLRQALQDGVEQHRIAQSLVQTGKLRKLAGADEAQKLTGMFGNAADAAPHSLEHYLFDPVAEKILPAIWKPEWRRSLVEWSFPALAALGLGLAAPNLPFAALTVALVAIFAAVLRHKVHQLEYRSKEADWTGVAGWSLLALALGALLKHGEPGSVEAAFVWLAMVFLSVFAKSYWKSSNFWLASPLIIVVALFCGHASGLEGWPIRALILGQLAMLLWSQFRSNRNNVTSTDRA